MVRHFPGLHTSIERATGKQIARKIGEVLVEMQADREERKEAKDKKAEQKGPKEFFGTNLPHILRLTQVEEAVRLNEVWADLTTASKFQQLLVLQRSMNKAAVDLSLRAPTVATPALLKMVLGLDFCLTSKDDLSSGLHAFTLGQHTAARRKLLKTRTDRHNLMEGGHAAPSLADAKELVPSDGVTIPTSHGQSRGQHNRLRILGHALFGERHTSSKKLKTLSQEMGWREQELEEYVPRERHLRPHVPAFIMRWVQIRCSNWLAQQWDSDEEIPFPNLAALWENIDDGEPWEPTFLDGYAPEDLARGGNRGFGRLEITAELGGGVLARPSLTQK